MPPIAVWRCGLAALLLATAIAACSADPPTPTTGTFDLSTGRAPQGAPPIGTKANPIGPGNSLSLRYRPGKSEDNHVVIFAYPGAVLIIQVLKSYSIAMSLLDQEDPGASDTSDVSTALVEAASLCGGPGSGSDHQNGIAGELLDHTCREGPDDLEVELVIPQQAQGKNIQLTFEGKPAHAVIIHVLEGTNISERGTPTPDRR